MYLIKLLFENLYFLVKFLFLLPDKILYGRTLMHMAIIGLLTVLIKALGPRKHIVHESDTFAVRR